MGAPIAFVTGGAGFIGRSVVERCLRGGYEVAVYDNLCAGTLDNLAEFADDVTFYNGDVLDAAAVRTAMDDVGPSAVFHLAAHHFIPFCNEHPQQTMRVNVEGTFTVLEAAARAGARVAVVASSGVVYPSLDEELTEDLPPAPPDVYGLSKWLAERVAVHTAQTTSTACVIARLFNTYGPYETNPHLIPHIVDSLRDGPTVELGNTQTKRDYIYVEDVAHLLVASSEALDAGHCVVNVGTGVEYSADDIIETLAELLGTSIDVRVDPDRVRAVDKMHQRASTRRLHDLVGATAAHSLREGLAKLIRHEQLAPAVSQAASA